MNKNVIFFDLDGTLIDSAPQIINSLESAFKFFNIKPNKKISSELIGPPINLLIKELTEGSNRSEADDVLKKFKYFYDNKYCFESNCYENANLILEFLSKKNSLILVTNKRFLPTQKILKHKNLVQYFDDYYSVNLKNKNISTKELLLKYIINKKKLDSKKCFYVGDTYSDFISSKNNKINFIFAEWGYGNIDTNDSFFKASSISELSSFFESYL